MVYSYKELLENGLNRYQIEKKVSNGELYKIEKGIYSNEKFPSELSVIAKKYPKAIFSYNTALYFYEMTERTPIKMDVTVYREYNPHRFKDLVNVYKTQKTFSNNRPFVEEYIFHQG